MQKLTTSIPIEFKNITDVLRQAFELENRGNYVEAASLLSPFWNGPGELPEISPSSTEGCRVWVRAGALTSLIGSNAQCRWQEEAKNILTIAIENSQSVTDRLDIWLEAQKELGNCYWREGSFAEARIVINQAISLSDDCSDLGLVLRMNLAMIERSEGKFQVALERLLEIKPQIDLFGDALLKGRFCNGLALSYKSLGDLDKAIVEMQESCRQFEVAEHKPLLTVAEMNLGNWFIASNQCDAALNHLKLGIDLADSMSDLVHLAQGLDSATTAYLRLGDYEAAVEVSARAVAILEAGDHYSLLVDSLVNHARALNSKSDRIGASRMYLRAQEIATDRISVQRAAQVSAEAVQRVAGPLSLETGLTFDRLVDQYKESLIVSVLTETKGGITEAASRLGMTHQHLSWLVNSSYPYLRKSPVRRRSIITRGKENVGAKKK